MHKSAFVASCGLPYLISSKICRVWVGLKSSAGPAVRLIHVDTLALYNYVNTLDNHFNDTARTSLYEYAASLHIQFYNSERPVITPASPTNHAYGIPS